MKALISIVTPCYNGEQYLERYFSSLLSQTYKNFEIIFVNDGSTDDTQKIALKYKKQFEKRQIKFIYLYQDNAGQAAAVNKGLKYISGQYLAWPDSDDFYEPIALEHLLKFLVEHDDYSIVRCKANVVCENNLDKVVGFLQPKEKNKKKTNLFEDFLMQNDVYFAPGCFMINLKYMKSVNPTMEINCSRAGQNWQILLPVLYNLKCGFIDEYLYNYVVRDSSHSHSVKTLEQINCRYDEHKKLLIAIINDMSMSPQEKNKYLKLLDEKYLKFKYNASIEKLNIKVAKKYFLELKQNKILSLDDVINFAKLLIKVGVKYEKKM